MSLEAFTEFTKPRFLLCEGDDDKGFFEALIAKRGLPEFQICHSAQCTSNPSVGGKTGFSRSLQGMEALRGWRDLEALLIVADNDVLGTSFADTQSAISAAKHTPPAEPNLLGSMLGKPLAVLMIPRHDVCGDLEKLTLPTIHETWPKAEQCVTSFLQCTGANNWTKPASVNKSRARAAAVGFYEPDPYKGIGHLFRNGTLSVEHACFDEIASFLKNFDAMCGI